MFTWTTEVSNQYYYCCFLSYIHKMSSTKLQWGARPRHRWWETTLMWLLLLTQRVSSCRCRVWRRDEPAPPTWTLHCRLSPRRTTATGRNNTLRLLCWLVFHLYYFLYYWQLHSCVIYSSVKAESSTKMSSPTKANPWDICWENNTAVRSPWMSPGCQW